jgi:hypothetical protein
MDPIFNFSNLSNVPGSYQGGFNLLTGETAPSYSVDNSGQIIDMEPNALGQYAMKQLNINPLAGGSVVSPELATSQSKLYDLMGQNIQQGIDAKNSWMGKALPYAQGFAGLTSGLGSLASIYSGFKQLDIMDEQLDIAKDQWAETKSELARVKKVRDNLNTSYMA